MKLVSATLFVILFFSFIVPVYAQDENKIIVFHTPLGKLAIELFPEDAPNHVKKILDLAELGFYDGTAFHRIIKNFMIQGGDAKTNADNLIDPGDTLKAEFNSIKHMRGIVSAARTNDPDSARTQFFIVIKNTNSLNQKYTAFGRLVTQESFWTLNKISSLPTSSSNRPLDIEQTRILKTEILSRDEITNLLDLGEPDRIKSKKVPLKTKPQTKAVQIKGESFPQIDKGELFSPKRQVTQGIAPNEVICKEGLVLIFKINGNEACVKPTSVNTLLQRGWASHVNTVTENISIDENVPETESTDDFNIFDTTGLLAYYNFEETSGELINVSPSSDSLGSAANMKNIGVLYEQDCIVSKCYRYHPSDKSKIAIDLSSLGYPVSFNGWVKKISEDGIIQIIMIGDSNTKEIFMGISENPGTLPRVILKNEKRTQAAPPDKEQFHPDDGWIMVTGVIKGDAHMKVYVNDVFGERKMNKQPFPANLDTMAINLIPDGTPMTGGDGLYDEISFWNRVLTEAEITKLYNGGAGLSLLPSN